MEYIPTTNQFVCVLNKKIESGRLLNALGHMSAGLVNLYKQDTTTMRFRDFVDKSGSAHSSISENGFIILRADNGNQIRTLRNKLIEENILFTDFTETMVPGNYKTQQETFDVTTELELEYFGVCFFADKDKSKELTKKFSLYQG